MFILEFVKVLGGWLLAIFLATLLGCALPKQILQAQNAVAQSCGDDHHDARFTHHERNEIAMSHLMAFSGGVCLAVAFIFQTRGFASLSILMDNVAAGCTRAGLISSITFFTFLIIEQVSSLLQDWHSYTCAAAGPCAVEVASAPLEAASAVRTLSEHGHIHTEEFHCHQVVLSVPVLDRPSVSQPTPPSLSAPLLSPGVARQSDRHLSRRDKNDCGVCQSRRDAEKHQDVMIHKGMSSGLILVFLLALFSIHSVSEGLGLGASSCGHSNHRAATTVALAILLHKTLSAFAVGAALLRVEMDSLWFWCIVVGFSLASPLGAMIGFATCNENGEKTIWSAYYVIVASATFLFISLVEFLPKAFDEGSHTRHSLKIRATKILLLSLGALSVSSVMSLA